MPIRKALTHQAHGEFTTNKQGLLLSMLLVIWSAGSSGALSSGIFLYLGPSHILDYQFVWVPPLWYTIHLKQL